MAARVQQIRQKHKDLVETQPPALVYTAAAKLDALPLPRAIDVEWDQGGQEADLTKLKEMVLGFINRIEAHHHLRVDDRGCFFLKDHENGDYRMEGTHLALHIYFPVHHSP